MRLFGGRGAPKKPPQPPKKSPKPDNSNFKQQPQWIFSIHLGNLIHLRKRACSSRCWTPPSIFDFDSNVQKVHLYRTTKAELIVSPSEIHPADWTHGTKP